MPPDGASPRKTRNYGPVLIVEDDAVLALAVEDALIEAGARDIAIAATTSQAIERLRDGDVETVILDVHLADRGDGWAIAEVLRALGPNAPKVIFATGSPDEIPAHVADLGPLLGKPYDFDDLLAHVGKPERPSFLSRLKRD